MGTCHPLHLFTHVLVDEDKRFIQNKGTEAFLALCVNVLYMDIKE
jgi:hypothetical protein